MWESDTIWKYWQIFDRDKFFSQKPTTCHTRYGIILTWQSPYSCCKDSITIFQMYFIPSEWLNCSASFSFKTKRQFYTHDLYPQNTLRRRKKKSCKPNSLCRQKVSSWAAMRHEQKVRSGSTKFKRISLHHWNGQTLRLKIIKVLIKTCR